jgi:hypothetical protein
MLETTILPAPLDGERVETGPVQFGSDWPGVFIRGDNALWYGQKLRVMLEEMYRAPHLSGEHKMFIASLNELADLLSSCRVEV